MGRTARRNNRAKMVTLFNEEMRGIRSSPMLLEIYRQSFSEAMMSKLRRLQEQTLARLEAASPKACCS